MYAKTAAHSKSDKLFVNLAKKMEWLAENEMTRNQEIFGQKLANYVVECLWILVIVMQ